MAPMVYWERSSFMPASRDSAALVLHAESTIRAYRIQVGDKIWPRWLAFDGLKGKLTLPVD